jgi:aldose 1-epimerase
MAPWVGRLRDGVLRFRGETYRFERTLGRHAIHGLAYGARWDIEEQHAQSVVLTLDLDKAKWPLGGRLRQVIELTPGRMEFAAEILCTEHSMPAALGWHPWFLIAERGAVKLQISADRMLVTDGELLPTGQLAPVKGDADLRDGPEVNKRSLDHVFVGVGQATLRWPDVKLSISGGETVSVMTVCVRDGCVCVEPQTAWPDAPTLADRGVEGTGLVVLEPGERLAAKQVWLWQAAETAPG